MAMRADIGDGLTGAHLGIRRLKAAEAAIAETAREGRAVDSSQRVDIDEGRGGPSVREIEEKGRFDAARNDVLRNAVER